ncbi:hypothetical protein MNBD_GAMMA12-1923 [hydrothermal vent metagenome]|uniref:STAS domain-containing protein n=1 Tax=hydrothermal vent metagenome TaxID=652676 RepID=A0A3B0YJ12_9ZZZZ
MAITINLDETNKFVMVSIVGRFDYSLHEEFKNVLDYTKSNSYVKYVIDLGQVDEIDSSAIGMILLLKDMAGGKQSNVELRHIRPTIKEELEVAQIYKLVNVA